MRRLCLTGFLALTSVSCSDSTSIEQVQITTVVTPDRITPGDTAIVMVRYTNVSALPAQIPDHQCLSPFEIANDQGEVVAGNEPVICTLELRPPIVLHPFESFERQGLWTGYRRRLVGGAWITEPVSVGTYRVYGRLEARRSAPDTIEVL